MSTRVGPSPGRRTLDNEELVIYTAQRLSGWENPWSPGPSSSVPSVQCVTNFSSGDTSQDDQTDCRRISRDFFAATKPVAAEVLIDTRPTGIGIVINGLITRETGFEVVRAIADIPQNRWKDVVYVLNSPGGSPAVAFDIAKAIADGSSFAMILSGSECASACFLMLAAAKTKLMAPDALIAIHSARTEGRGEDWDALATTAGMGKILSRYGIPAAIIGKMVSTPASEILRLTVAEMQSLPGAVIRGGGMPFQDFTRNAVPVDEYRAGLTAGKLIAAHVAWAGNRCDFVSSRFRAGCLDGLRHPWGAE